MASELLASDESSASTGSVVVVGAINVDFVIAAGRLPRAGETVVGRRLERHGGGKGANAAVAAARGGAAVRLIGAVGDDDTGRSTLEELHAEGIDVGGIAVIPGESTGVALIVVDPKGENQIAVGAGANASVEPSHVLRSLANALPTARCVLVSTEIAGDAVAAAVEAATAAGVRCVLNPAPVVPGVVELLKKGPIVTPNQSELAALLAALGGDGAARPTASVRAAVDGARRLVGETGAPVVITMGADGAMIVTADGTAEHVPAPPAEVRDTTGAGDTFNGVLAARLAAGDELAVAVRTAVVAASLSVGHAGARGGMPTASRIVEALGSV